MTNQTIKKMSFKFFTYRKSLFLLIAGVCIEFATPATAQTAFGVKGGMSINSLSFDDTEDQLDLLKRPGFFVGPTVKVSIPLGGLGIDAAVMYEQRNAKHNTPGLLPRGTHTTTVKHQQIAIPLNLRYDYQLNEAWGIYAYAGPQVGFNVGKDIQLDYGEWRPTSTTVAINAGLGVTLNKHLELSAGYSWSCGKNAEIWLDNRLKVDEAHFNSWQFSLGYFL